MPHPTPWPGTESQRAEDRRIREAVAIETERQAAKRFILRTSSQEGWPDEERLDVLRSLGLEEPEVIRKVRANGHGSRAVPKVPTRE